MLGNNLRCILVALAFGLVLPIGLEANTYTSSKKRRNSPWVVRQSYPQLLTTDSMLQTHVDSITQQIIRTGESLLGLRYRASGVAPWPLDCSGYVGHLFRSTGLQIPRTSQALSQWTYKVDEAQPGDLVFFKGRNSKTSRVGHVALVVDNTDGVLTIMHSTNSRGIIKHRLPDSPYFRSRFLFVGRAPMFGRENIIN